MKYIKRILDLEIQRKLQSSGAVLIRGAKACGKTESAKQLANSVLNVDRDAQVEELLATAPGRLLVGDTPRLIDEWQVHPKLWNHIRHEIDERKQAGQFILTGSANPEVDVKMHSGAGRFTTAFMRTMTWQELGFSSGKVSMNSLFESKKIDIYDNPTELEFIIERIIIGGFPALIGKNQIQAMDINRAYVELLSEIDMSRVSNVRRDPIKVRNLLKSLARNSATSVEITTLEADINNNFKVDISRPTIYDYLDALNQLMITEEQPSWNTHIRSSSSLRKTPKRHFADVSLATAALGVNSDYLLSNLNFSGFLFESLVIHELRVYAQANDAIVYYYRDSSELEVDAIIQKFNGDWIAVEIKLGTGHIDEAASNLKKLESIIDNNKINPPKSLNIITGTGISYTRNDGVNVISISSLGA